MTGPEQVVVTPYVAKHLWVRYGSDLLVRAAEMRAYEEMREPGEQLRDFVAEIKRAALGSASARSLPGSAGPQRESESPPWIHLTVVEVAESLSLARSSVRRLCGEGKLSATKRGRDWQIDPTSVEDFERDQLHPGAGVRRRRVRARLACRPGLLGRVVR